MATRRQPIPGHDRRPSVLGDEPSLALAATRIVVEHGQLCPVWTERMSDAPIGSCDCWVVPQARRAIRVLAELGFELRRKRRVTIVNSESIDEVFRGGAPQPEAEVRDA